MNTTIEAVKDEVAAKYEMISWAILYKYYHSICSDEDVSIRDRRQAEEYFFQIENEAIELYHTRKLEEAGKELPTLNQIIEHLGASLDGKLYIEGSEWMKEKAFKLLASKQYQLEAKDKEIERLKGANQNQSDKILCLESEVQKQSYEIIKLKSQPKAEIKFPDEKDILNKFESKECDGITLAISDSKIRGAKWAISEVKRLNH